MSVLSQSVASEGRQKVRIRECCRCGSVRSCTAQIANNRRVVNATFGRVAALAGFVWALGLWFQGLPAAAQTSVALELVLAVDTSTSVDEREFVLQQQGFAEAFRHPDVIRAIERAGGGGVAVTLVHWSGRGKQRTSVGWTIVRDAREAEALAAKVEASGRILDGFTDIAGALRFSLQTLQGNGLEGRRKVIDVSGDGTSNGPSAAAVRDAAIARGVTVNGLVIHNEEYDLGELAKINLFDHYKAHVVGGPGAFLMAAKDFRDFRSAIRKKLVREITGPLFSRNQDPEARRSQRHHASAIE